MKNVQLSELVDIDAPLDVLGEIEIICKMISTDFDTSAIRDAFTTIVAIYQGNYPGYQACNTEYHDLRHAVDTLLAMTRLVHGMTLNGYTFTEEEISIALIAALFHDSGFIQEEEDTKGTGAKYTQYHVPRSADMLRIYLDNIGTPHALIEEGQSMIYCTDLSLNLENIIFPNETIQLLGKSLASVDLLTQMADPLYLEKLLFLYHEFREGKVLEYEGELDLLNKTVRFYDFVNARLEQTLGDVQRYMVTHFAKRWHIESNLYQQAIGERKAYLEEILATPDVDPRDLMIHTNLVERVREKYGQSN